MWIDAYNVIVIFYISYISDLGCGLRSIITNRQIVTHHNKWHKSPLYFQTKSIQIDTMAADSDFIIYMQFWRKQGQVPN